MPKIGVAIITFNRPDYYKQVLEKIPKNKIDHLIVINDGKNVYVENNDADCVIKNNTQLGVAISKNKALKILIEKYECDYIFIVEDDVLILDENVFDIYIDTANIFGVHHLNFEKVAGNDKTLKYSYESPSGHSIGFYHNPQGAFSFFNSNIIKKLGYFDENYTNAFEHIDLEYNLAKNKVAPPFWYFPDVLHSDKLLTTIEGSDENSTITNKEKYRENWDKSAEYFVKKHGFFTNTIQEIDKKLLPMFLIHLEKNYSRKKLYNKNKKLAIIIPYRDRKLALDTIIPKLSEYVSKQVENFEMFVVEQDNNNPFNKGLLNNLGFLINPDFDYYCFHDVDLIPEFSDYSYPEKPTHLSSHCSQFNYINIPDKIMGGVITFQKEHFIKVNGYPNNFEGWGKEDDCLYLRCEKNNLNPYKHPFGRYFSVPHQHRLTNEIENELHLKNGKKFKEESEGLSNGDINGLSTIDINKFLLNIKKENLYTHIKIKL
jgi:hypothetical protein